MRRYEARSRGVFIRKVAYDYVRYGYVRYAFREIPEERELKEIDEKLLRAYDVTFNRMARKRRRENGEGVVSYVRYDRWFVLLATEGRHEAFDRLAWRDIRSCPLQLWGYSIGEKGGSPWVTISARRMKGISRFARKISLGPEYRVRSFLQSVFRLRFPGVVWQEEKLLRRINRRRKKAGLSRIRLERGYRIPKKPALRGVARR